MHKTLQLVLLSSCFIYSGVQAENLIDVFKQAEQNNPSLKIANSERLAILEKKPQAQSQLNPQVSIGGDVTQALNQQNFFTGDTFENTSAGYNVSLSYALYRRAANIQIKQADSQISQSESNYTTAYQNLIENVAARYFDVLAGNDNVEYAVSTKTAIQRQLDQTTQRFDVGLIAITDVQEAQAGYDLAVADEILARNQRDNALEALREVTGYYYNELSGLKSEVSLASPDPANIEAWAKTALEHNPQLEAAKFSLEIARQEIERQRAAKKPTVDVVAQHGYRDTLRGDSNPMASYRTQNSVGVQLSYSLYQGGAIRSRIREAQQRYTQAMDQVEQVRRTVNRSAHNAYLNVLANISQTKALKQALVSTKTALDAIQTGFDVGTRTSVDVLNAQRDLFAAQRNYSRARYDYLLNTLRLKQAAGLIAVDDLAKINKLLVSTESVNENSDNTAEETAEENS